jgi:hypothetical protein
VRGSVGIAGGRAYRTHETLPKFSQLSSRSVKIAFVAKEPSLQQLRSQPQSWL